MDNNGSPVTLIIKAPTQHIDDQVVECGRNWTIERLKKHISNVYPNKPNPADQRLIYYGQLLNDTETLQEILTRIDSGESIHILHLVCIPSREAMSQTRNVPKETPGVERVGAEPPVADPLQPNPPTPEDAYRFFMNPAGYQPWMNQANGGYFQQLAWAQHVYANYYMSQYMDMLARQNGGQPMYATPGPERDGANPVDAAQPRVDEDERNRDWLDTFYIFARLVVLFSIVYFYSSPARFMIVSFLGIVMYLYQVGFFRLQHVPALENNNEVLNNNIAAENNNHVENEAAVQQVGPQEAQEAPLAQTVPATPPTPTPPLIDRPSLLSLTWTFFSSFFASLIPENHNPV